jgi:hypothetical protein
MIKELDTQTMETRPQIVLNDQSQLDLVTLIETRLVVQANSGGGKSWAIRRLLEQSHGFVQHLILDVEGSFRTLREHFEYLLLGSATDEVDAPISTENAAEIAHLLLETRTSAIVDLYEFLPRERQQIVRVLLEALINAPKALWHDCLVVVDEAHIFCPEQGAAEAKSAVEALCSRGRARGFCAVLATQRLSKLGKDAAAECNNKLIGRATLDVDLRRCNAELEFPTKSQELKRLVPGSFYLFGPATASAEIQKIQIGQVRTTHPRAGSRRTVANPPAPTSLSAVLARLQALPVLATTVGAPATEPGEGKLERVGRAKPPRRQHRDLNPQEAELAVRLAEKDAEIGRLRAQVASLSAQVVLLGKIEVSIPDVPTPVPLPDLPAALHLDLDTLHIVHATIAVDHLNTVPREEAQPKALVGDVKTQAEAASTPVAQSKAFVGNTQGQAEAASASELVLRLSEQKVLEQILLQIQRLSASEKLLFAWLLDHDGKAVSSKELADAVSQDILVTRSERTSALLKIPFIKRTGTNRFLFQCNFVLYARRAFSSVKIEQDWQVLRERLVRKALGKR